MVRFESDKLVIEMPCVRPFETWQDLLLGLYGIIRMFPADEAVPDRFYSVIDFLAEALPGRETAKKMQE